MLNAVISYQWEITKGLQEENTGSYFRKRIAGYLFRMKHACLFSGLIQMEKFDLRHHLYSLLHAKHLIHILDITSCGLMKIACTQARCNHRDIQTSFSQKGHWPVFQRMPPAFLVRKRFEYICVQSFLREIFHETKNFCTVALWDFIIFQLVANSDHKRSHLHCKACSYYYTCIFSQKSQHSPSLEKYNWNYISNASNSLLHITSFQILFIYNHYYNMWM